MYTVTKTLVKLPIKRRYKKGSVEVIRVIRHSPIYDIFYLGKHLGQFKGDGFLNYKGRQNEFFKHYQGPAKSSKDIIVFKKIGGKIFLKKILFHQSVQKLFTFKKNVMVEKIGHLGRWGHIQDYD